MGGEETAGDEGKPHAGSDPPATDNDDKGGSDSEGDGAEEILEESPDKRWSKRREKVKQRDVPGIDAAYLAMDNETGNEVVWNEVLFSERKNFRDQEEKLKAVFDNLTHLVHVNLVKFHKYWTDAKSEKPRIIFITEYMSSGSMSRFLQRTSSSGTLINVKAWKKWTTQILSALNYLHQCNPPIVHANLSCNTVFIQQNGLIKIGCVAPNTIHHHVKTFRENLKNMHYLAPEQEHLTEATTQADIYSFGICALEMALTRALIGGSNCNGSDVSSSSSYIGPEAIRKSIDALEDPSQKEFIELCLNPSPEKRPTAQELLFHPVIFEVHSLKLIAAHAICNSKLAEQIGEDDLRVRDANQIAAESKFKRVAYSELSSFQVDLEKFLEDVKNGIYPLIAFAPLSLLPSSKLNSSSSMSTIAVQDSHSDHLSPDLTGLSVIESNATISALNGPISASTSLTHDDRSGQAEVFDTSHISTDSALNVGGNKLSANSQHKNGFCTNTFPNSGDGSSGASVNNTSSSVLVPSDRDEGYHTAQSMIMNSSSFSGANTASVSGVSAVTGGEARLIQHMQASIDGSSLHVLLRLDDQMNRQLTTEISAEDTADNLVIELVQNGFISEVDSGKMCSMLTEVLDDSRKKEPHLKNSPT